MGLFTVAGFAIKDFLIMCLMAAQSSAFAMYDPSLVAAWFRTFRPPARLCQTWSELTPCNAHFRELAEYVKRGIWEAGGVPFEFPIFSTG